MHWRMEDMVRAIRYAIDELWKARRAKDASTEVGLCRVGYAEAKTKFLESVLPGVEELVAKIEQDDARDDDRWARRSKHRPNTPNRRRWARRGEHQAAHGFRLARAPSIVEGLKEIAEEEAHCAYMDALYEQEFFRDEIDWEEERYPVLEPAFADSFSFDELYFDDIEDDERYEDELCDCC